MFNSARRSKLTRQRVEQERLEQAEGDEVGDLFNALAALFRELPNVTGRRVDTCKGPKSESGKTTAMVAISYRLSQVVTSDVILVDVHRADQTDCITETIALPANWLVRTMVPTVLAATGLTDDAADLEQLPELTAAMFCWPDLLDRADRIVTSAAGGLSETVLAERRAHPRELIEFEYDVLRAGVGAEALEMADGTGISVLPHLIGQHAYRAVAVGVQLLHLRHRPAGAELLALRDQAVTGLLELQEQLAELHDVQQERDSATEGRTCRLLPVWAPQPRFGA